MLELLQTYGIEKSCVTAACTIGAVGVILNSLEYVQERCVFQDAGLLDWNVCKLANKFTCSGRVEVLLNALFSDYGFGALLVLRIIAGLALCCFAGTTWIAETCSIAILLLLLTFNLRHVFGRDGSDQMLVIVFAGLSAYFVLTERFRLYALMFIALQATLSYVVAGYAKLVSPVWRRGDAIIEILGTRCYGAPRECRRLAFRLVPSLSKAMCWAVILFECVFPVLWFAPKTFAVLMLSFGLVFHLGVAVLMGLNVFLWAFLASYPAVLVCHFTLHPEG